MRIRLTFVAILAFVVAVFMPYTASAAEISAAADVVTAGVAAEQQLVALGINPGDAVFQRGARNYAGADCPGANWNCTTATVVVQIGVANAPNASNQFDCDPASAGTNAVNTCVAIQFVPAGEKANNHARCRIHGSEPTQSCTIDQTNLGGGSNDAQTDMLIDLNGGSSQSGTQNATVRQRASTGDNQSHLTQSITLTTEDVSAAMQTQLGIQSAVVCQGGPTPTPAAGSQGVCPTDETDGNNFSHVDQSLSLRATAAGGSAIIQNQNVSGGPNGCSGTILSPNTAADIEQRTTSGKNHSQLKQSNALSGRVRDILGFVDQNQGSVAGGLEGCVFQKADSAGFSSSHASQSDDQDLSGPPLANQTQYGPEFCCTTQVGPGTVNIDQRKSQSSTSSTQFGLVSGRCSTPDGQCTLDQRASNNVDSERNSVSGTILFEVVQCDSFSFEGEGEEISGGDCFVVAED